MNNQHDNTRDPSDAGPLLTAHALNELSEREQGQVEQLLAADPQAGQTVEEVKRLATALRETCVEPAAPPVVALREAVVDRLDELDAEQAKVTLVKPADSAWRRKRAWLTVAATAACVVLVVLAFGERFREWSPFQRAQVGIVSAFNNADEVAKRGVKVKASESRRYSSPTSQSGEEFRLDDVHEKAMAPRVTGNVGTGIADQNDPSAVIGLGPAGSPARTADVAVANDVDAAAVEVPLSDSSSRTAPKNDLGKTIGAYPGPGIEGRENKTHSAGSSSTARPAPGVKYYNGQQESGGGQPRANPSPDHAPWQPAHSSKHGGQGGIGGVPGTGPQQGGVGAGYGPGGATPAVRPRIADPGPGVGGPGPGVGIPKGAMGIDGYEIARSDRTIVRTIVEGSGNSRATGDNVAGGEQYEAPPENAFLPVDKATALSTFSIDVDTASYANVRRFLSQNQLPPPHAVRIEEMLNYFRYTYPQPQGEDPFAVSMELADCPWQPGHELLRIGIKGKEVEAKARKAGNLVFLVDVSGSMQPENKLPLLKQSLKMLVGELTENDTVTIVTYAGDAGLKLDATNGTRQNEIRAAIDSLSAGGSTHGSAGIELAYQQAAKSFIKGGTNRVILATDGDLNVGITSDDALVELIKTKAAGGVFLTVLGVGEGNLKDAKMEKLADNGNGVYAYLDSLREARKVLVEQLAGSLETIAKDVKLQIEFNPAEVQAYRLIGYENRVLATRDFHDDKKDAGEIGAGHTVTALYELVPARAKAAAKAEARGEGEPLKYQKTPDVKPAPEALTPAAGNGEVLTLKLRFKQPDAETSKLREYPLKSEAARFSRASADFQFAAAVASFGMLLKNSQHRGDATFSAVEEIAAGSIGPDASGYRAEFLDLVRKAKTLK